MQGVGSQNAGPLKNGRLQFAKDGVFLIRKSNGSIYSRLRFRSWILETHVGVSMGV